MMNQSEIEAMFGSLYQQEKMTVAPVKFQELKPVEDFPGRKKGIDYFGEIDLNIEVELGSTQMSVRDVLDLDVDTIVELDCLAGEPVDINLNGIPFASGEIVVINENFGTRINKFLLDKTENNLDQEQE